MGKSVRGDEEIFVLFNIFKDDLTIILIRQ